MSVINKYLTNVSTEAQAVNPMQALEDLCTEISIEAFGVASVADYFTRKAAKLSSAVREAFRFALTRDYRRPDVLNVGPLTRMLSTIQYTELADENCHQPVGFKGNLYEYTTELLNKQNVKMMGMLSEVVKPAQQRFAFYLNNPEDRSDRRAFEAGSKYSLEMLEEMKRDEAKWSVAGNHSAEVPFGLVFNNNNEIAMTCQNLNKANETRYKTFTPQQLEAEVNKLVQLASTFFDAASAQGQTRMSAEFVQMVAQEVQTVARWVEWYSLMTVRFLDTTAAMKENEKWILSH